MPYIVHFSALPILLKVLDYRAVPCLTDMSRIHVGKCLTLRETDAHRFLRLNSVPCLHPGMDVRLFQLRALRCGPSSRPRKSHPGYRGNMVPPVDPS